MLQDDNKNLSSNDETREKEKGIGNNNLSDDNVSVGIKPTTDGNKLILNLCSLQCIFKWC